jgi:TonB family protein
MSASWWLGNLTAYSVQVALVVLVGGLAAAALRLKQPRVMLAYWQAVLVACLLLPLLQLWQRMGSGPAGGSATIIGIEAGDVDSMLGLLPLRTWVLPVLVAGVGLGLLRLALGLWRLNRYRHAALRISPLPSALREAQALVGVEPAFYFSDRVESPVTFGWLGPAIIFPRRFEGMDESHQRAIACHELLHVARRDWLMNLLEQVILTFLWFHPAIWWVMRSIRLSREQVVDCEVVALTGARKPYLHALLEIATASRAMPVPAPLFLVESQLARRVASLAKEVRMSKPRLIASLVIALAVVAGTTWWAVKTFWLIAPPSPQGVTAAYRVITIGHHATATQTETGEVNGKGYLYQVLGYKVGEADVTFPTPIYQPEPPYAPRARKDKVDRVVDLLVAVDARGNVADVKLVRGAGEGLDESAVQTLRKWKFHPALKKGYPVPTKVAVEVDFKLF